LKPRAIPEVLRAAFAGVGQVSAGE